MTREPCTEKCMALFFTSPNQSQLLYPVSQFSRCNSFPDIIIDSCLPTRSAMTEIMQRICIKPYGCHLLYGSEKCKLLISQGRNIRSIDLRIRTRIAFIFSHEFFYIPHNTFTFFQLSPQQPHTLFHGLWKGEMSGHLQALQRGLPGRNMDARVHLP